MLQWTYQNLQNAKPSQHWQNLCLCNWPHAFCSPYMSLHHAFLSGATVATSLQQTGQAYGFGLWGQLSLVTMCDMASSTWYMNGTVWFILIWSNMYELIGFAFASVRSWGGNTFGFQRTRDTSFFFRGVSESKHAHHERKIKKNCQMPNMPSLCHVGRSWGNTSWAERTCQNQNTQKHPKRTPPGGGVPFWHFSFGEEILWGAAAQRKNC